MHPIRLYALRLRPACPGAAAAEPPRPKSSSLSQSLPQSCPSRLSDARHGNPALRQPKPPPFARCKRRRPQASPDKKRTHAAALFFCVTAGIRAKPPRRSRYIISAHRLAGCCAQKRKNETLMQTEPSHPIFSEENAALANSESPAASARLFRVPPARGRRWRPGGTCRRAKAAPVSCNRPRLLI